MIKKFFQIYSILLLSACASPIGAMDQELEQEKVVAPTPPPPPPVLAAPAPAAVRATSASATTAIDSSRSVTGSSETDSANAIKSSIVNFDLTKLKKTEKKQAPATAKASPIAFNTSMVDNNPGKPSDTDGKKKNDAVADDEWKDDEEDRLAAADSRRLAALARVLTQRVDTNIAKATVKLSHPRPHEGKTSPSSTLSNYDSSDTPPPVPSFPGDAGEKLLPSASDSSQPTAQNAPQAHPFLSEAVMKLTRLCCSRKPNTLQDVVKHVTEVKSDLSGAVFVKDFINAHCEYGTPICYALDLYNLDVCAYLVEQGAETKLDYEDFSNPENPCIRTVAEVLEIRTREQKERKQMKENVAKLNDLCSFHSLEEVKTYVEKMKRTLTPAVFVRDFVNAGKAKRKPIHNAVAANKLNLCLYLADQGADTTLKINNNAISLILEEGVRKREEARREEEKEEQNEREFREEMARLEREHAQAVQRQEAAKKQALEDERIAEETKPFAEKLLELCKSKEENALEDVKQYVEEIKAKLSSEIFVKHFINARDYDGTPLCCALDADNLAVCAYLVEQGADTTEEYEDDYLDENGGNRTIAEVIKIKAQELEIKPFAKKLKALCLSKENALEAVKKHVEEIKATLSAETFVKYFINARFKHGTPICYAIGAANLDICGHLVDQGADMAFEFYDKDYKSRTVAQALEIKTQELKENQIIIDTKPLAKNLKVLCKSTKENTLVQIRKYVEGIKTRLPEEVFVKHVINAQFKHGTPIRYAIDAKKLDVCTYLVQLGADTKLVCRYDAHSISQLLESMSREQKELELKQQALLKEAGEQQNVDLPAAIERLIELCSKMCFSQADLNNNAMAIRTHIEVMKAKLPADSFVQDFIKAKNDEPIGSALMAANMVDAPELVHGKLEICAYLGSLGANMAQTYAGKTVTECIQEAAEQEAQKLKELDEVALKQLAILEARQLETARVAREKAEQEKLQKEKERLEREAAEQKAREQKEREALETARLARERAEQEKLQQEKERLEREAAELKAQEQKEREALETARLARERAEQEKLQKEKERLEREAAELKAQEQKEREALETARLARERAEQEKLQQEKERLEREAAEQKARELKEQEALETARLARERAEQEETARKQREQEEKEREEAEARKQREAAEAQQQQAAQLARERAKQEETARKQREAQEQKEREEAEARKQREASEAQQQQAAQLARERAEQEETARKQREAQEQKAREEAEARKQRESAEAQQQQTAQLARERAEQEETARKQREAQEQKAREEAEARKLREAADRLAAIKAQQKESARQANLSNDDEKKPRSWLSTLGKVTGAAAIFAGAAILYNKYVKKQQPARDAKKELSKQDAALQEQTAQRQPQTKTALQK